jgi:hypothetical protein
MGSAYRSDLSLGGTWFAAVVGMNEFTPEQEQFITEVVSRLCRRYADVIEKLATEVHALTMVLVEKRLITVERLEAARRQLDLAYDLTQALQIRALIKDIDELDAG